MIALIVAVSKNYVIGNKGKIPWNIKGEQKRFKELTTGNVVIMGRRSFEEIEKPLKDRDTIVISTSKNFDFENCTTASSLEEAIDLSVNRDIFIAGGERIYKEAMDLVDIIYVTEVDIELEGDTFFQRIDEDIFVKTFEEEHYGEINYKYVTYKRKKYLLEKNKNN